ncbi:hypothetical protein MWSIV6_0737 [Methanothermobacter wolfeii]|nr:hypothetical protein MWSIV6_0737 [Methanothermobacter wolfeii]
MGCDPLSVHDNIRSGYGSADNYHTSRLKGWSRILNALITRAYLL